MSFKHVYSRPISLLRTTEFILNTAINFDITQGVIFYTFLQEDHEILEKSLLLCFFRRKGFEIKHCLTIQFSLKIHISSMKVKSIQETQSLDRLDYCRVRRKQARK